MVGDKFSDWGRTNKDVIDFANRLLNLFTETYASLPSSNAKELLIQQFVNCLADVTIVGSVVEWLKRRARNQHGLGLKPTCAILLYPWKRRFTAYSPAWWSWQAVLNYSHISIKLQADSNILVSPEADRDNCLPYVLAPPSLSCESEE